jgi:hypothetical protein
MSLFLWQGNDLLGELHERPVSARPWLQSVLLRASPEKPLNGVMQVIAAFTDRTLVMQTPRAPDIVAERHIPRLPTGPSVVGLTSPPPRPPPPEMVLTVRTADGTIVPARLITLEEHRPLATGYDPEIDLLPASGFVDGSVWLVCACLADTAEAI